VKNARANRLGANKNPPGKVPLKKGMPSVKSIRVGGEFLLLFCEQKSSQKRECISGGRLGKGLTSKSLEKKAFLPPGPVMVKCFKDGEPSSGGKDPGEARFNVRGEFLRGGGDGKWRITATVFGTGEGLGIFGPEGGRLFSAQIPAATEEVQVSMGKKGIACLGGCLCPRSQHSSARDLIGPKKKKP